MTRRSVLMVLAAVFALGMFAGCTRTVVVQQGPEVLQPGEYIESSDAMIKLVHCRGKGIDKEAAILNARKGCLEWMIVNEYAQSPGELQAYRANQKQIFANIDRYVPAPHRMAVDGKGEGTTSVTQNQDGSVNVEVNAKVFKKQLEKDLVQMNIVASKDDVQDSIGNPSVVAGPSKAVKGKRYRKDMEQLVNSYLTKEKFEVVNLETVQDLDKMQESVAEATDSEQGDLASLAAAAGADVYVEFEAKPEKKNEGVVWAVNIKAYETTTGKMLASDTGFSGKRSTEEAGQERIAMAEGLNVVMGKIIPQIKDYWKEYRPRGRKFRVSFMNPPKNSDFKLDRVLKKVCSKVKVEKSTPSLLLFYLQCKMDNMELSAAISEGIESKLGMTSNDYEFPMKNRNMLVIKFK